MSSESPIQPAGWYYAQGDPPGTQRYWDGASWQGSPQPVGDSSAGMSVTMAAPVADAGPRIGARLIDILIWIALSIVPSLIFLDWDTFTVSAVGNIIVLILISSYEIGMAGTSGATLGKRALGLKIVKENGSDIDLATAAIRFSPYIAISLLNLVVPLLGGLLFIGVGLVSLVLLFSDDRHRTVWDRLAKTEVWSIR